jgi:DNA-directed RNA polymerase specialized sigma24 family protein
MLVAMSDVTSILARIESGDPHAAEQLLPLVYDELRKLAAARLAQEKPGQTLDATALVHEAYLRLVAKEGDRGQRTGDREERSEVRGQRSDEGKLAPDFRSPTSDLRDHRSAAVPATAVRWDSRGHFFAAAAVAMRRILVENARRKQRERHGGKLHRVELNDGDLGCRMPPEELLALDEALVQLAAEDPVKAKLVELRFFVGMTGEEAAQALGISLVTAKRYWRYARAWLHQRISGDGASLDINGQPDRDSSKAT